MTAVEASTLPLPKHGLDVNMEDRKRPATHDPSDSTPPLKKQATTVNGNGKPHPDADMPWKDDLEVRIISEECWPIISCLSDIWGNL